ncbi:MAG: topoisomerase C-terminal repeat-containing protein [Yersinia sp. (in: enterobacteria)]
MLIRLLDTLEDFIAGQVNNVDLSGMAGGVTQSGERPRLKAVCPKCSSAVVISAKVYACCRCDLKVWGEVASKKLTVPQVETLFSKGKTTVLKGFKSKAGKAFDAKLVLDTATGKVNFEFENKK